jgi:hypothetical protein
MSTAEEESIALLGIQYDDSIPGYNVEGKRFDPRDILIKIKAAGITYKLGKFTDPSGNTLTSPEVRNKIALFDSPSEIKTSP